MSNPCCQMVVDGQMVVVRGSFAEVTAALDRSSGSASWVALESTLGKPLRVRAGCVASVQELV